MNTKKIEPTNIQFKVTQASFHTETKGDVHYTRCMDICPFCADAVVSNIRIGSSACNKCVLCRGLDTQSLMVSCVAPSIWPEIYEAYKAERTGNQG